jgi:hypothetical protein
LAPFVLSECLPEALRYLSDIKVVDIGKDDSQQVWPAARIALHVALLNNISDREAQLTSLQKSLTERDAGFADGAVQNWARNELCDRGDLASLPTIREWLNRAYAGSPTGQEEIRYCEARMQVVSRGSDRVQALASVLRLDDQPPDTVLMSWAISQLAALHSPAANRELARFGAEIGRLPKDSTARQRLFTTEEHIRIALATQAR